MSDRPDVPTPADRPERRLPLVPDVQGPADLRCSDVDRERVAEALRQAAGEGRLTLTELEERLEATFKAQTYGQLQPITADLPQGPYPMPGGELVPHWQRRASGRAGGAVPVSANRGASGAPAARADRITAILSSERRTGRWEVPNRIDVMALLGEVTLDFTEAIVRSREIVIQAGVIMSSVTLIVPEGIDVRLEQGANVLGERKMKLTSEVTPGSPVYHVRGFVVLGEITVRPPKPRRTSLFG